MLNAQEVKTLRSSARTVKTAVPEEWSLGPLKHLPGTWSNSPDLQGRGWNMIALPYATPESPSFPFNYRLLMNQFNEVLTFTLLDGPVPNRGIDPRAATGKTSVADQFLMALDYVQVITQLDTEDFPPSDLIAPAGANIHHEPGLWLHITNQSAPGVDIARLASIPHGDSVLALGRSSVVEGPPVIPDISGLPVGIVPDVENNPYLAPYKNFHGSKKFRNLFDAVTPNDLLKAANSGIGISRTTVLEVDTHIPSGRITNIPFIIRQANATRMQSTFWIEELEEKDRHGNPKLRLQYSQTVLLEFFPRQDGLPGSILWPHISINTLEKVV